MILRTVSVLLWAALLTPQSASAGDSRELATIHEELRVVAMEHSALLRNVPGEFDEAQEIEVLRRRAEGMGLAPVGIRPASGAVRLSLGDGSPSDLEVRRLELSGRDSYQNIDYFLRVSGQRSPATSLEFFEITPASETVRYSARIAYVVYAPLPEPDRFTGDVVTAAREELARMKDELSLLRESLEMQPRDHVPGTLAILQQELEEESLTLNAAAFESEVLTLRGMLIGSAAREALDAALRSAGLEVIRKDVLPLGRCHAFEIVARPSAGERSPGVVLDSGIFEVRDASICTESRPEPLQISLPGSTADEPSFLRLRGADLDDAFHALNDLIGGGFVVDSAIDVRVNVDVPGTASVDEVLESLASVGVAIGPGPIRTVTAAKAGSVSAETRPSVSGELVSFSFKDIAISAVLCLIGSVTEREVLAPSDLTGRVSIYATDVSLGDLTEAILAASGLVSKTDGERLVFMRAGVADAESGNPCAASSLSSRLRPASEFVPEIRAADVELFGLTFFETPKAYIYGVSRRPIPLVAGDEIHDATVRSIDADGIVFTRRDGSQMRVPLAPVKRSAR